MLPVVSFGVVSVALLVGLIIYWVCGLVGFSFVLGGLFRFVFLGVASCLLYFDFVYCCSRHCCFLLLLAVLTLVVGGFLIGGFGLGYWLLGLMVWSFDWVFLFAGVILHGCVCMPLPWVLLRLRVDVMIV